jgi:hypothetical protein
VRYGIAGELITEIVEREAKARRELQRVGDRFGKIGKQAQHLLRCLDISLAVVRQQLPGGVEMTVMPDTGEYIEDLPLFRPGILRALGREQWQLQAVRQLDRCLVAIFLRAVVVALQLNIHVVAAIDFRKTLERVFCFRHTAMRQGVRQRAFVSAGHANQPRRKFGEIIGGGDGLRGCQQLFRWDLLSLAR